MEYQEALDYLYSRLPVFHRIGPKALKPGLANTLKLCEALGNPQHQFRAIHVAGTNGKGSTSHMLAAIYQTAGYRVGLYTSPHLKSFTERIRLNGQPIPEVEVARFVRRHQDLIEAVEPSFFEVTVAMAFDYFARQLPDVAIIEVGLGGRLDSTNVLTPLASVITNIGFDHMDILGNTLPQIAREKAGIIKPHVPVVVGETHPETSLVFDEVAREAQAPLVYADARYTVTDAGVEDGLRRVTVTAIDHPPAYYELDLIGTYQLRNLLTVLATIETMQAVLPVSLAETRTALRAVAHLTGLQGRFQLLQQNPRVIADTAHNLPGLEALFQTLNSMTYARLHVVIGFVADKDRANLLAVLPKQADYYFCQAETPRSLPVAALAAEAKSVCLPGNQYADVNQALTAALQASTPADLIVITGSNYIIAELANL